MSIISKDYCSLDKKSKLSEAFVNPENSTLSFHRCKTGVKIAATHMIKDHPTPRIFMPHESGGNGVSFRQASDGRMIFHHRQSGDTGRGAALRTGSPEAGISLLGIRWAGTL
ncbi:MAG: hypothetical protein ACLFTW_14740 [Chitinispirillaceae bacterium]